ncbi:MAG: retroviral-like aspartic protease [Planctomycetes bacterium]|nr:retroviral-like aspartic protease [Planctomycetota bacterium]
MGIIRKRLLVIGHKGRTRVEALFDTGASHSMLREDIAPRLGVPEELPEPTRFHAAVGTFEARKGLFVDVVIGGKRLVTGVTIVPDLTEELILGDDFLQRWHIRLDPRRREVSLDRKALRVVAVGSRPGTRRLRPPSPGQVRR